MLTSVPGHCLVGYPRRSTTWAVAIGLVECSFTARRRFPGLGHTIILSFSLQENFCTPLSGCFLAGISGLTGANIVGKWLFWFLDCLCWTDCDWLTAAIIVNGLYSSQVATRVNLSVCVRLAHGDHSRQPRHFLLITEDGLFQPALGLWLELTPIEQKRT